MLLFCISANAELFSISGKPYSQLGDGAVYNNKFGKLWAPTMDLEIIAVAEGNVISYGLMVELYDAFYRESKLCPEIVIPRKMLIRLQDGTILEKEAVHGEQKTYTSTETEKHIRRGNNNNQYIEIIPETERINLKSIVYIFEFSKSEIESMIDKGVAKIRVSASPDYYEKTYKKDNMRKPLKSMLKDIDSKCEEYIQRISKGFEDDF